MHANREFTAENQKDEHLVRSGRAQTRGGNCNGLAARRRTGNGFDRFGFWEFVGLSVGSPGRATRLWA